MAETTYSSPDDFNQVKNPLQAMSPGEQVLCEIKRHPIGMISRYVMVAIFMFAMGVFAISIIPGIANEANREQVKNYAILGLLVAGAFSMFALWIGAFIYYRNRWIVTSDSITQLNQTGLFSAQLSQLSMANLQDITVVQDGFFPTYFNYGILRAESAGEHSKFVFIYCPNPKKYAQLILMARENYINSSPETAKRANDDLAVPRGVVSNDGLRVDKDQSNQQS